MKYTTNAINRLRIMAPKGPKEVCRNVAFACFIIVLNLLHVMQFFVISLFGDQFFVRTSLHDASFV